MLDWQQIDTVFLDMDGTLLDLHFDNYFWQHHLPRAYALKQGISLPEAEHILFTRFTDKHGTLDWYCLEYWGTTLGLDIVSLKREVSHLIAVRPGTLPFLQFLREQGKRSILVTNAHRASLNLKMERTGIHVWFDSLISSHDFGFPKEHPDFWQKLAIHEPFTPARTLFVDDTHTILDAAKQAGIGHVLGITLPDSRGTLRQHDQHTLITDLSQLTV